MANSAAYNVSVLEKVEGGMSVARACRALKRGERRWRLPGLFFVIRVQAQTPRRTRIFIPVMILPILLLGVIAAPFVQLVYFFTGQGIAREVWAGLWLLVRLQFVGRGPIIRVRSKKGEKVDIGIW